jgi:hypothetical protein
VKDAICNLRRHFNYDVTVDRFLCKVFPRGIPSAILIDGYDRLSTKREELTKCLRRSPEHGQKQ